MTREELEMRKLVRESDVIDKTNRSELAKAFNYLWDKYIEQEPCKDADMRYIYTQGLEEGIRCAMCTNSMKSDRGCDGGCVVDNVMYKKVMDTIHNHIFRDKGAIEALSEPTRPKAKWISVDERLPETDNENNVNRYDVLLWVKNKTHPEREPQAYIGKLMKVKGSDGSDNFWGIETKDCEWTIWGWSYFNEPEVLAWMPLPEPYKAESENKNENHISLAVIDGCKNLEDSYGDICVRCNECGRFDQVESEDKE